MNTRHSKSKDSEMIAVTVAKCRFGAAYVFVVIGVVLAGCGKPKDIAPVVEIPPPRLMDVPI